MTKNEFIGILKENGYKPYQLREFDIEQHNIDGYETFGFKHKGDYYREFGETEVAFRAMDILGNVRSVWLSIECQDAKVETNIHDINIANIFLVLMGAEPIKFKNNIYEH